jgi:hypothetical protein
MTGAAASEQYCNRTVQISSYLAGVQHELISILNVLFGAERHSERSEESILGQWDNAPILHSHMRLYAVNPNAHCGLFPPRSCTDYSDDRPYTIAVH